MKNKLFYYILIGIIFMLLKNFLFKDVVYFRNEPREDNNLYGFFEINSKKYHQLYTTTQVNIDNGLHYHKIDLRSSDK